PASACSALAGLLAGHAGRPQRVGLEPAHLPAAFLDPVRQVLRATDAVDIGPQLRRMRMVKGEAEIEAIARATAACDRIFSAVERTARSGCTELDVYLTALRVVAEESAGPASLDGDFVSGPRTAGMGGPPTPRALRPGELLIVDVYPRIGGYCADCTRSYALGEPSQVQLDLHALLVEAMQAGERTLEPGRPTAEVYQAVKRVLDRAEALASFPHHAGHALGLTPSEDPRLVPGSRDRLEAGMVVTLEPGLYAPDLGGMRLEDNFLVTESGARCLTHYPRRLVTLPCA
ncbi:MAG: Xaa-Pro peptidase family protein, partial [Anaerolineae bacterium]|nr:Xaa-Pro peptidase family protein [Anaerolineae bacterium]